MMDPSDLATARQALNEASVLALMARPDCAKIRIWTPTVVVTKMRLATSRPFPKPLLNRAKQVLEALWKRDAIVMKERLNDKDGLYQVGYMRLTDAAAAYFVCCDACGGPRKVENGFLGKCRQCDGPARAQAAPQR